MKWLDVFYVIAWTAVVVFVCVVLGLATWSMGTLAGQAARADTTYSGRSPSSVSDGVSNATQIIDYAHHEAHAGSAFTANLTTVDLDDNPLNISFTTSDTLEWPHLTVTASTSGAATVEIREAPTGGVENGTDLVPLNRDRNSANPSSLIATHEAVANELTQGASAGTNGTVLVQEEIGAGKDKVGGNTRGTQEFILRQNTTYCVRLTSVVNLVRAVLEVDWYEHTNR